MSKNYQTTFLAFYLERGMMTNPDVIQPFVDSVNDGIAQRDANTIAFFIPTDREPRIKCINPLQVAEADMERINKIVEDLTKNFDVGQGAYKGKDNKSNEIEIEGSDD